ncbi:hypothetical protein HKD37_02G005236 [Glycine soja]
MKLSTSLAVETLLCQASKVDHRPSNNFRFNSKVKYNCFSVPEQNLGLRFQKDATKKMKTWIVGTVIILLMSITRNKWGPLLKLLLMKGKIGTTIDKAERVVEKVAEVAVKNLPIGKLQDAAEFVENVDKQTQNAEDVLEKIEDKEEEVVSFFESNVRQKKTMETLCQASKVDHDRPITKFRLNSKVKYNCFSLPEQNLGLRFQKDATKKMSMVVYASIPPGNLPSADSFPEKIETTIEQAERVADIVEEVAERVDKIAEGAAKNLPEGKLQDVAEFVENVAENVDKLAEEAGDLLEKVEDKQEEVVSFFESTVRQQKSNDGTTATDSKDKK